MWDWFFANALWFIIISLMLLAFLFLFSFRKQIKQAQEQTTNTKKNLPKIRVFILAVIATAAVAVVLTVLVMLANLIVRGGIDISLSTEGIKAWLSSHGVAILAIVLSCYVAYRLFKTFIPRIIERSVKARYAGDESELSRRAQTLSNIIISTLDAIILMIALMMVLAETGRDITPLLAGAGIAGVAIGFGAQSLVKDILNGLFIIMEDQYRRGDIITIAGLSGMVEDVSLRRTVLRDRNGTVHTIPNGQIVTASNMTKEWARVNIDIPIAYYEDVEHVMSVIDKVGKEVAEDPDFKSLIISPPKALRVDEFNERGIIIKVLGDTKPLKQWDVAGELRKRIKIAFDKEGIAIPWAYGGIFAGRRPEDNRHTCPKCGSTNPLTSTYCAICGAQLNQPGTSQPNKPPVM